MNYLLSYPVKKGDPTWPGNPTFELTANTSISHGDAANTAMIHLFNHYGTHIDGPLHFYSGGLPLYRLPLERFLYEKPFLAHIPKGPEEKIEPEDLSPYEKEIEDSDLLLIRTGFWKIREEDPKTYENHGPAVSSRTAKYLVERFPNLKAIALDFVSLASYSDSADGDLAHQYMLGMYHDYFICIIEDVNLSHAPSGRLISAAAIPLMIEGIDSSPVTMWARW
ncbi:MAG: cyclase family protein [Lacrimispora sp.]